MFNFGKEIEVAHIEQSSPLAALLDELRKQGHSNENRRLLKDRLGKLEGNLQRSSWQRLTQTTN